ncbi:MAG: DUF1489 domain-containing protein [Alphaproteobacteria bacterium]|nr:DUF1489 domain-containing protein [Alphaproteobacteria bacterium]
MPLHLLKLAVGIDSIDHLRHVRAARRAERGGSWVYTRNHPRRTQEVLAGGSMYWVIRGHIRVRQRILGFRGEREESGRHYCLIEVDEMLVPTVARAWRPFQGWRYLPVADAPPDRPWAGELPSDRMLAELQSLGLI